MITLNASRIHILHNPDLETAAKIMTGDGLDHGHLFRAFGQQFAQLAIRDYRR